MTRTNNLAFKNVITSSGNFKNKIIKPLDYSLGGLLVYLLRPKDFPGPKLYKNRITKILVIRPGGIGDAVLLLPFLKELKRTFSSVKIDILAEKRNMQVFSFVEGIIDNNYCYDNPGLIILLRRLKKENYDIVFDTEQWHNLSAIFSFLVGRKMRVGFDTREARSQLYTHLAHYLQEKHEKDNFLEMLKVVSPDTFIDSLRFPFIFLSAQIRDWAKQVVPHSRPIAVCLSASIKERFWGVDNFSKICNYLISKNYSIVFLGGNRERNVFRRIFKGISNPEFVYDFVGKTNLNSTAALINLSKFYIGLDTGILHIAYALDVPTISLFGPGIKDKWAPPGEKHIIIDKQLSCSPCTLFGYTPVCNNVLCMKEIKPEDVISAINKLSHE